MSIKAKPIIEFNAAARAALIKSSNNGHPDRPPAKGQPAKPSDIIEVITTRRGRRWVVVRAISQLVYDAGMLGGPWFMRVDAQDLPLTREEAVKVAKALGITSPLP